MQRRLWAFAQRHPESAAYHIGLAVKLRGRVDLDALGAAVGRIVERHEALRTAFVLGERELVQRVRPPSELDVTLGVETIPEGETVARATEELRRPFDLGEGRPLRVLLLRTSDTRSLLVLVAHHIVADEWSLGVVWRELCALYGGGEDPPAPSAQFPAYTRRQERRNRERSEATTRFWIDQLRDADPGAELPTDRPHPALPRFHGAFVRVALPEAIGEKLRALAAAEETTPFAALLALYGVLLYQWTGKNDLSIGIPSANRTDRAAVNAVGLFIGSLPFRSRIEPGATFRSHLAGVRKRLLAVLSNQNLDEEAVVEALAIPREPERPALFRTMFVTESDPLEGTSLAGLETERVELDLAAAKFDLSFFAEASGERTSLAVEYDTDLFDATTARALLNAYAWLLEQVVADPDRPIDALTLARDDERVRLLETFGPGPLPAEPPTDVLERIRDAATATPDGDAVRFAGESTPYVELIESATDLAGRLLAGGAGARVPVGLHLDRSAEMVIGVLGALDAGAAYVPLDPSYPPGRLRFVLDELARATGREPLVVTMDGRPGDLGAGVRTLAPRGEANGQPANRAARTAGSDLAYVIHTSGSTGTPKGVAVTRANLAASTAARIQTYGRAGRFLLVPSFAFDSSVAGLFWTLATGGTLVIPRPDESRDARALARLIREEGVTHTLMLPSLWQLVLKGAEPGELSSLRSVVVAGEACSVEMVRAHHAALDGVTLHNEYGPTEATVWASVHRCDPSDGPNVPIGRPIPGARVYVLDARGRPAPVGFSGELCVGGPGVAAGYWRAPEATAERFVDDPFGGPSLLYRTGDRARVRADGTLEFLGRADAQLKVRGVRIEPGEIEACLAEHPAVDEAGVALAGDRLVAFVRAFAEETIDPEALRAHARSFLVEPMVPAAIVELPELPRLANGKLDRRKLAAQAPALASAPADARAGSRASLGEAEVGALERSLATLWAGVLGVEHVGVDDDFFQLGGHSLAGVQLLLDVKQRFGIELPLAELFEKPRLSELAHEIRERTRALSGSRGRARAVSPVHTKGTRPPLFCVHAPAVEISATLGDDQPVYLVFTDISEADRDGTMGSVRSIAEHYLRGIQEVQPIGPYHLIGYSFGATLAYEIATLLLARGETVGAVGLTDPTLDPGRMRVYAWFDRLRRKDGFRAKADYALGRGFRALRRRLARPRPERAVADAPTRQARIRAANMRRYVEIADGYAYEPSALPCLVIVPDGHPSWLRYVRRHWQRVLAGPFRVEVIRGAHAHMDLVKLPHSAEVIGRFAEFLREAEGEDGVVAR